MAAAKFRVGDVVFHKSGEDSFVVCDVEGDEVVVRWFASGKFHQQALKARELTKKPIPAARFIITGLEERS